MPKITKISPVPAIQNFAYLNQAGAVQNTWYTILDTVNNARIIQAAFACTVANETLEVKITIDGLVWTGSANFTAGTVQYPYLNFDTTDSVTPFSFTTTLADHARRAFWLEGRTVKIEMRKTTAAGASALQAKVHYAKW